MDTTLILKSIGILSLIALTYISFLPIKNAPLDKFGGGEKHTDEVNKHINELKRKTIFRLIINSVLITTMSLVIIANLLIPETITNQITLIIFIACLTSLGIKLGYDINKP